MYICMYVLIVKVWQLLSVHGGIVDLSVNCLCFNLTAREQLLCCYCAMEVTEAAIHHGYDWLTNSNR